MVEILRVLQEAAIEVSGRGEEPLSPTTQETIMIMQFERYTIITKQKKKARTRRGKKQTHKKKLRTEAG